MRLAARVAAGVMLAPVGLLIAVAVRHVDTLMPTQEEIDDLIAEWLHR